MTTLLQSGRFGAAAFNVKTDIPWHTFFWAEDPAWTNPGNGNQVSQWDDTIGGHHVTQATAGDRPIFRSAAANLNNRPAIEWVTNDMLSYASTWTAVAMPRTIVCVLYVAGASSGISYDGSTSFRSAMNAATNWTIFGGTSLDSGIAVTAGVKLTIAEFLTSPAANLEVNGTVGTAGNAGSNSMETVRFGRSATGTTPFTGFMGMWGLVSGTLTSGQKTSLRTWSQGLYGTP